MEESLFTKKSLLITSIICSIVLLFFFLSSIFDTKTRIVFCDVGQGDGAYIRVENRIDVVIDAGPDRKILDCLGKYMPFYDREVELAFMSHPQKDHFGGYLSILDRYKVDYFIMPKLDNTPLSFSELKDKLARTKTQVKFLTRGDKISVRQSSLTFLWPDEEFMRKNSRPKSTNNSHLPFELHDPQIDVNGFSQVIIYTENSTNVLFTGDLTPEVSHILANMNLPQINILKVPHHGSKNGLTEDLLNNIKPQQGIISVGARNTYGHPAPSLMQILERNNVRIRRTDKEGSIVFKL